VSTPPSRSPAGRRRRIGALAGLLALALLGGPPGTAADAAPAPSDGPRPVSGSQLPADGPLVETIDRLWSPAAGAYRGFPGSPRTRANALLLRLHVRALVLGADSPLSPRLAAPERARQLVDALSRSPAFVDGRTTRYDPDDRDQSHRPGFTQTAGRGQRPSHQHIAIDPEVALALAEAVRARAVLGLRPAAVARARRAVLRTAGHPMFSPRHVRIGQLLWTTQMLWAKRLVDGDRRAFARAMRRALDTEDRLLPRLLTRDGGYRYQVKGRRGDALNRMDTPEYSLIALAGIQFLPQARADGMRLRRGELARYRRWGRRVVWGAFGNDGLLNWDTAWGADRRYLVQYWGWASTALQALAGADGVLPAADRRRARALCRRAQQRVLDLQDARGLLPKVLYGAATTFAAAGRDRALGSLRMLWSVSSCPEAGIPRSAASFDREQQRYAVTTPRYTTAVVGWSRDLSSGALPVRLLDGDGRAIGGLGGRRSGFDLVLGDLHLGGRPASGTRVRLSARRGSGPLTGRGSLRAVVRRGTAGARLRLRFGVEGFRIAGTSMRAAVPRWRIPLGEDATTTVEHRAGRTILRVSPARGASWSASVAGTARVGIARVGRDRLDPTVRRVATLALPRGRRIDLRVAVGPSAGPS
jgi:hypothetical protein